MLDRPGRQPQSWVGFYKLAMLANITCHLAEISKSDVLNAAQTTSIFSALSPSINKTWGALHDARGKPVWWTILKLFPYVTTKCRRIKGLTARTDTPRGDSRSLGGTTLSSTKSVFFRIAYHAKTCDLDTHGVPGAANILRMWPASFPNHARGFDCRPSTVNWLVVHWM